MVDTSALTCTSTRLLYGRETREGAVAASRARCIDRSSAPLYI